MVLTGVDLDDNEQPPQMEIGKLLGRQSLVTRDTSSHQIAGWTSILIRLLSEKIPSHQKN